MPGFQQLNHPCQGLKLLARAQETRGSEALAAQLLAWARKETTDRAARGTAAAAPSGSQPWKPRTDLTEFWAVSCSATTAMKVGPPSEGKLTAFISVSY